jgi:pimeloyl-ACP methyl ester carboxylesterase
MAAPELHYESRGSGAPALVFVHGFACALGDWQAQVDHFAPTHRCVALDLPGHGASPRVSHCSMPELAGAVNAVRKQATRGPVVLVGHSLGVRVVIDAYLAWPQDVAGLVLVDGRFYDGDPQEIAPRIAALVDGPGFAGFARTSFTGMFTERSDPAVRERIVERACGLDPAFGRELLIESILWDSTRGRDALRRIAVPVLHLQSSDIDANRRMVSLQPGMRTHFMEVVESLVPRATVRVVPGVGHFAALEAPAVVNAQIEAFLGTL